MTGDTDLHGLEHEVDATRERFARSLDKLTSPETAAAAKREATEYAQNLKSEVMAYVDKTKTEILDQARTSARGTAEGFASDLKEKALANPVAVALIGAGIGWRLYKHPPITTLLVGAGIALLASGTGARRPNRAVRYDPYDRERPSAYVPGGVAGQGTLADDRHGAAGVAGQAADLASRAAESAREIADSVREAAYGAASRVSDAADAAGATASDAAGRTAVRAGEIADIARRAAYEAAGRMTEAANAATSTASQAASRGASTLTEAWDSAAGRAAGVAGRTAHTAGRAADRAGGFASQAGRNPFVLGALGLAVGALVARTVRRTEAGGRIIGQTYRVLDQGAGRVTSVASEAVRNASDAATGLASAAGGSLGAAAARGAAAAGAVAASAKGLAADLTRSGTRVLGLAGERSQPVRRNGRTGAPRARRVERPSDLAEGVKTWFRDDVVGMGQKSPLLLAAVCLSTGAAIGGAIRLTDAERRSFAPLGAKARRRAEDAAAEALAELRERAAGFAVPGAGVGQDGEGAMPPRSAYGAAPAGRAAEAARDARPDPLTPEERQELERRLSKPVGPRPDAGRAPDSPGVSSAGGGLVFTDEDHVRAAFGSAGSPLGGADTSGRMPGGFGGDGYSNYGSGGPVARTASAASLADTGDLGRPDDGLDEPGADKAEAHREAGPAIAGTANRPGRRGPA